MSASKEAMEAARQAADFDFEQYPDAVREVAILIDAAADAKYAGLVEALQMIRRTAEGYGMETNKDWATLSECSRKIAGMASQALAALGKEA